MSSLLDNAKKVIPIAEEGELGIYDPDTGQSLPLAPILRAFVEMARVLEFYEDIKHYVYDEEHYHPKAIPVNFDLGNKARDMLDRINEDQDPTELECPDCHVRFQPREGEGWTVTDVCPNCQHTLVVVE